MNTCLGQIPFYIRSFLFSDGIFHGCFLQFYYLFFYASKRWPIHLQLFNIRFWIGCPSPQITTCAHSPSLYRWFNQWNLFDGQVTSVPPYRNGKISISSRGFCIAAAKIEATEIRRQVGYPPSSRKKTPRNFWEGTALGRTLVAKIP